MSAHRVIDVPLRDGRQRQPRLIVQAAMNNNEPR